MSNLKSIGDPPRYTDFFILKIKHLRSLAKLLGKLGIPSLRWENSSYNNMMHQKAAGTWKKSWTAVPERYNYGIGLKQAKDMVEGYLDRKASSTTT